MATRTSIGSGNWSAAGTWDTGVPGNGDTAVIAAGHTVTFDGVNQSGFANGLAGLTINGTLTFQPNATSFLKMAGDIIISATGHLWVGTVAGPILAANTVTILMNCGSNVQYGITAQAGADWVMQGAALTQWRALLAADAGAGATSLTSDVATGWKSGDSIAIASTTRTASECESKAMTGDATGTTIPIAALTNAHSGTSPTRGEIANLTRNIVIRGASAALQTYVNIAATAGVDWDWAEFKWLGSATAGKRGIDVATTTGSFNAQHCSFHDFEPTLSTFGLRINTATATNVLVADCLFYNIHSALAWQTASTGVATITGNLFILGAPTGGSNLVTLSDAGLTFANNTIVGALGTAQAGLSVVEVGGSLGTFSGNVFHSNTYRGLYLLNLTGGTVGATVAWRNGNGSLGAGLVIDQCPNLVVDTATLFGNNQNGLLILFGSNLDFRSLTANAGATLTQAVGIGVQYGWQGVLSNSSLGATTSHTTGDIRVGLPGCFTDVTMTNCILASTTEVANQGYLAAGALIRSHRHDQTAGAHRVFKRGGLLTADAALFRAASPSQRLTAVSHSEKCESSPKRVSVPLGSTRTVSVWVRESVVGDGADYDGSRARLLVRANPAAGLSADTILATATAASEGAWEKLTGATPAVSESCDLEFVVDCDGDTGWVNVDDWDTPDLIPQPGGQTYWFKGEPSLNLANGDLTDLTALLAAVKAKTDNLPADPASNTEVNGVVAEVAQADLAGYEATAGSGTRLGEMLAAARAGALGRLQLADSTLTLYEVDGSTVIARFTVAEDYSSRTPA